jgi:hypothetical protein
MRWDSPVTQEFQTANRSVIQDVKVLRRVAEAGNCYFATVILTCYNGIIKLPVYFGNFGKVTRM